MGDSSELEVINDIKCRVERLTLWFRNNCIAFFSVIKRSYQLGICNEKLSSTSSETLLGMKLDNKLTFEEQVEILCEKKVKKDSAAARLSPLMRFKQRKWIVNLFITSHFFYRPLLGIIHSRPLNNLLDHIRERALRITYQDYNSSFKELLRKDSSLKQCLNQMRKAQVLLHNERSY